MLASLRWYVLPAVLAGCLGLLAAGPAAAKQRSTAPHITDRGKFFSEKALDQAEAKVEKIKRDYNFDLLIETYGEIKESIKTLAEKRYESQGIRGVVVLISRKPTRLEVMEGKGVSRKEFPPEDRKKLRGLLLEHMEAREFDKALLAAVDYVDTTLEKTVGRGRAAAPTARTDGGGGTRTAPAGPTGRTSSPESTDGLGGLLGMGIWGWVCVGLVALLALWVLIGLVRAFSGAGRPVDRPGPYYGGGGGPAGRPAPGYGPGYGGPPGYGPAPAGGGGGGGFFSSLLGGMLGAGAGMWAYDNFFRGGHTHPTPTPPPPAPSAYGGAPAVPQPDDNRPVGDEPADWGGGASEGTPRRDEDTGGADWSGGGGADSGGADWGGGGDNSGGGDTSGGADWGGGGGGGDTGGADWGGGGDSGGADWGGGGGGSDNTGGGDW